jgi:CubicO group peptidase (beta-lactamase class C family)
MKKFLLFTALLVALYITDIFSQTTGQVQLQPAAIGSKKAVEAGSQEIAARVDDFLNAADLKGGVLVAKNGKVILNKGYGWTDEGRKIPNTTKTIFDIGSITKQFTAAAILKLEEQGKLKVTDSITEFFKDVPPDKADITLHHLLTHSAGLINVLGSDYDKLSREEMIKGALASKLHTTPGGKYKYSNLGYSLLAAIIEIAGGKPYERFLYDNFFKPTAMKETGYVIPNWKRENLAVGYLQDGTRWGTPLEQVWDKDGPYWNLRGNGGILSTVGDLYKWHLALEGEKILSRESKLKYFAPHVPMNEEGTSHYGYGWSISKTTRNTRIVGHAGSNNIFYANFRRYVDENVVIINFTNEARPISSQILSSIPRAVFGGELPSFPKPKIALNRSELQKHIGTYELPSGDKFDLEAENSRLTVKMASSSIGKLLTTFPKLEDSERLNDLESRTARIIENIAKEDYEPIREAIYFDGTFDEEKAYWKRTFAEWTNRFGTFKKSEVVGSVADNEFLNTYVLLQFERGRTIVQFRQNEKKQFNIGTNAYLLPRFYRLVPQSKTEFVIYNYTLQTTTPVKFSFDERDIVTGLTIENEQGKITARKILPVSSK